MLLRALWYCYQLSRSQWLKPADLKRLQEKRLRAIITHTYENVPLYHSKFDSAGIKPSDIKTLEDLRRVPFTTKEEIRRGIPHQSIAKGYDTTNCAKMPTSGTSSGPMPVFYDKRFLDYTMANWYFRRLRGIGVNPWDKVINVKYNMPASEITPYDIETENGPRKKRKSTVRIALGSVTTLLRPRRKEVNVETNPKQLLAEIADFKPKLLDGSPSYLRLIGEMAEDTGADDLGVGTVRSDGEVIDQATRRYLENSFNCKVFDEYSTWDFAMGAWECKKREGYHIDADLLVLEVLQDNEQVSPGEKGELVATGLLNYAMPLIRYRVGDLAVFNGGTCSCGRGLPLIESIEGRIIDCLKLPSGRTVTPKEIMSIVQGTPGVSRYQLVQQRTNKVTIELMRKTSDPEVSIEELRARCQQILGNEVEIEVFTGDRKNLKAKFRPVISKLTVAGETRWTKPRIGDTDRPIIDRD